MFLMAIGLQMDKVHDKHSHIDDNQHMWNGQQMDIESPIFSLYIIQD